MIKFKKKLTFLTIFWVLFYFLAFGLLLKNSYGYLDPDLGWHLKVGQEISRTYTVPHLNTYNYTYTGRWVDHEWLANFTSFQIYDHFGYLGLNIFFALIIVFSLILLNFSLKKIFSKIPAWTSAFFQLFGLIACLPSLGIRMQEFGLIFILLELLLIADFSRRKKWRILLFLPILFYFWASIHGSFILGLGLLFAWIVIKTIERYLFNSKWQKYFYPEKIIGSREVKIFSLFFLFSVIATLITAYGIELYSFLNGYRNTAYLGFIQEWKPEFAFPFNYYQLLYLALIVVIFGLYFYELKRNKEIRLDSWALSLLFLFLAMSFRSVRHFPLMFTVTFPFIMIALSYIFPSRTEKLFKLRNELKLFLLVCLILSGLSLFISLPIKSYPFNSFCSIYPCNAEKFLETHEQYKNLRIFNNYNWGGYLIWVNPSRQLFIDGRLPQTEYAGHTLLEEYLEFYKPGADYQKKLDQYNIQLVLIKTGDNVVKAKQWEKVFFNIRNSDLLTINYLGRYLDSSNLWEKIYSDSVASIYLKVK